MHFFLRDAPARDARSRGPGRVRLFRVTSPKIVRVLVQHDAATTDVVEREVGRVEDDVVQTPALGPDIAQVSEVTVYVARTAVPVRSARVVVRTHARASLGRVAALVHVEPVQTVLHSLDAHVADLDTHPSFGSRSEAHAPLVPERRS